MEVQLGSQADGAEESSGDEDAEDNDPAAAEAARQETARRQKQVAKGRKARADPAHAGMQMPRTNGQAASGSLDVGALTLADQEAIALRILGAQALR